MIFALLFFQSAPQPNALLQFLPMLLIFGIFYFLLFLPMQRQKKAQREMIAGLKEGARVQTSGGIIGKVRRVDVTSSPTNPSPRGEPLSR